MSVRELRLLHGEHPHHPRVHLSGDTRGSKCKSNCGSSGGRLYLAAIHNWIHVGDDHVDSGWVLPALILLLLPIIEKE